jgi:hypothetical protein
MIHMYVRDVMVTVLGFHNLLIYRTLTNYDAVLDHCLIDSDNRLIIDLPNLDQILSNSSHISLSWVTSVTNGFDSCGCSGNETG